MDALMGDDRSEGWKVVLLHLLSIFNSTLVLIIVVGY